MFCSGERGSRQEKGLLDYDFKEVLGRS